MSKKAGMSDTRVDEDAARSYAADRNRRERQCRQGCTHQKATTDPDQFDNGLGPDVDGATASGLGA